VKVLHVAETIVGGIASHLCELLPLQTSALGEGNVHVIIPDNQKEHLPRSTGWTEQYFDHPGSRLKAAWQLRRVIVEAVERFRPDILHVHSSFAGLAARSVTFPNPPAALIYCPHGWSFAQQLPEWKRKVYAVAERQLLSRTDAVICVSEHERNLALAFGLSESKLRVIRNGVAELAPTNIEENLRPKLEDDSKLHFLFVGRFDVAKGVDYVFDAANELSGLPIHFHLIGDVGRNDPPLNHRKPDNVTLYGWRSRQFVADMLEHVDALLMPSRWEGMPMIGLEAFRAGCPIIGSNRSAMPELIGDDGAGIIINLDDPRGLSDCLRSMNRPVLEQMAQQARSRYQSHFTIERQHQQIMQLYQEYGC
jgi:glycosyltransferase involved in cell wall biosynthesis